MIPTIPPVPTIRPQSSIEKAGAFRGPRVFEFFRERTVPLLSRFFPSEFWTYDVLQLCESVPAIRHCVLALASLHIDTDDEDRPIGDPDHKSSLAAGSRSHYLNAVSCLRRTLDSTSKEQSSVQLALVASVLLAIYESLLGCGKQSRIHVHHGIQLALQSRGYGLNTRIFNASVRLLGGFKLGQQLQLLQGDNALETSIDGIFMDIISANQVYGSLEGIVFRILSINHRVIQFGLDCTSGKFLGRKKAQETIQAHLLSVNTAIRDDLETRGFAGVDCAGEPSIKILRAQLDLNWIIIRCGMTTCQTLYDSYTRNFEIILQLVESVLVEDQQANGPPLAFSLDLGFLALLLYLVRLCRHPVIRRKAIDLMAMCPPTDGSWDRQRAIAAARAVLRFEEEGEDENDNLPRFVPEERRVHHILFNELDLDADTSSRNKQSMRITFMTRPMADMVGFHATTFRIPVDRSTIEKVPKTRTRSISSWLPKSDKDLDGRISD